jgi:hypothetical protein
MLTLTFSLRFADGQKITARIDASSNLEDAPVCYHGPLDRLPLAPRVASGVELRAYLQSFARELKAHLSEEIQVSDLPLEAGEAEAAP